MTRPALISAGYLAQQQELHRDPNYGVIAFKFAPFIRTLIEQSGARSVSDYGAGKCGLRDGLHGLGKTDFEYFPYDPAFPEYGEPKPADLVCCLDVLEHIEPEFIDAVLAELAAIVTKLGLFSIATVPAIKTLPDGRNAHIIIEPLEWWTAKLVRHFNVAELDRQQYGFVAFVTPD